MGYQWPTWYPSPFHNQDSFYVEPSHVTEYPYQSIGLLTFNSYYTEKKCYRDFQASAFCADLSCHFQEFSTDLDKKRNVILTAAHNLYDYDYQAEEPIYSTDIVFQPAMYSDETGNHSPYGTFRQLPGKLNEAYFIHPGYQKYHDEIDERPKYMYDIGLILLDKNEEKKELFDVVEPLPIIAFKDASQAEQNLDGRPIEDVLQAQEELFGKFLTQIGYPLLDTTDGKKMRVNTGRYIYNRSVDEPLNYETIHKEGSGDHGCSGGPWINNDEFGECVGVAGLTSYRSVTHNCSVSPLFTKDKISELIYEVIVGNM